MGHKNGVSHKRDPLVEAIPSLLPIKITIKINNKDILEWFWMLLSYYLS